MSVWTGSICIGSSLITSKLDVELELELTPLTWIGEGNFSDWCSITLTPLIQGKAVFAENWKTIVRQFSGCKNEMIRVSQPTSLKSGFQ